jgi:hypothetical protein
MKIPFKDAIGKNDLLHITLMNCLTPEVIDSARENAEEDMYEDFEVRESDLKELNEFIASWNEKQTAVSYFPDYKIIVIF